MRWSSLRKFENNEDQNKNFPTQTKSVFLPKIRWRPKKTSSVKKKSLHSNLVRFLAQNYVKAKKMSSPTVFVLKPSAQVTKRGAMPQFAYYFMLIILFWRPKGGAWLNAPPLNTSLYENMQELSY